MYGDFALLGRELGWHEKNVHIQLIYNKLIFIHRSVNEQNGASDRSIVYLSGVQWLHFFTSLPSFAVAQAPTALGGGGVQCLARGQSLLHPAPHPPLFPTGHPPPPSSTITTLLSFAPAGMNAYERRRPPASPARRSSGRSRAWLLLRDKPVDGSRHGRHGRFRSLQRHRRGQRRGSPATLPMGATARWQTAGREGWQTPVGAAKRNPGQSASSLWRHCRSPLWGEGRCFSAAPGLAHRRFPGGTRRFGQKRVVRQQQMAYKTRCKSSMQTPVHETGHESSRWTSIRSDNESCI